MRAGPPFPYLRWSGPRALRPPPPARPRGRRAAASATSTRLPVTGCANASRAACRNWRAQPVPRPASPYSGSPTTGWPMASRCARIWCVRPVSSRTRSSVVARQRPLDLEVRDGAARLVRVGRHARAHAPVAAERRVDRAPARRRAAVDERRGTRARARAARAASLSAACTGSLRATTSRPEVSRSSRCTMPARSGSSPPAARPASAWASVPPRCPRAGMDDDAGGLVDDEQVLVLPGDRERRGGGLRRGPGGGLDRRGHRDPLAARERVALRAGDAVDGDRAGVDQPLRRGPRAGVARRGRRRAAPRRLGRDGQLMAIGGSRRGLGLAAAAPSST